MNIQHTIWLESHPDYDEEWLKTALHAGFDIHHIDGNHDNNDPENLLLIEKSDHKRLHGINPRFDTKRDSWESRITRVNLGEVAYNRRRLGETWKGIGDSFYHDKKAPEQYALNVAKVYAEYHKRPWPIPHVTTCDCWRCNR